MPDMTLEQAQARILELTEENNNLRTERDTLSENNNSLNTQLEEQRALTQKYFNKLIAEDTTEKKNEDEEGEEIPTCEEFAKNIKF